MGCTRLNEKSTLWWSPMTTSKFSLGRWASSLGVRPSGFCWHSQRLLGDPPGPFKLTLTDLTLGHYWQEAPHCQKLLPGSSWLSCLWWVARQKFWKGVSACCNLPPSRIRGLGKNAQAPKIYPTQSCPRTAAAVLGRSDSLLLFLFLFFSPFFLLFPLFFPLFSPLCALLNNGPGCDWWLVVAAQ